MSRFLPFFMKDMSPEQHMVVDRVLLAGLLSCGSYILAFDPRILSTFLAYFAVNIVLLLMQQNGIWKQEKRLFIAIMCDAILAFVIMHAAPAQMSLFYPVLLWMTLSSGFRFGIKWLLVASLLSTLSFGSVVLSTDYWAQNQILGFVLAASLLVIPAYCSTLIRHISEAKEQADLASQAKSYFLASVSHELRTPLNAIIGYGNHLRQLDMPRGQKDMVEASVLAGEHLLHLIEQLIDVARLGNGKTDVKKAAFRATDLLAEVRDVMTGRVEEKGLTLYLQAEPMSDDVVEGPANVIRNIILNLVGNATKFTEAGSITISCGMTVRNSEKALWFAVSDTGIGICDSAKDLIFQPFQQADETVMNRFGGTGLGLSICKQLTKQVDGEITVESQVGQGSIFRVEIPVQTVEKLTQFDDFPADVQINILAIGRVQAGLLASAQAQENFHVRQIDCVEPADLLAVIANPKLPRCHVAFIPEYLTHDIASDDILWAKFAQANIAPILVSEDDHHQSGANISKRPFTSVLQATASFAEIRSAIKIGFAFARKIRMPNVAPKPISKASIASRVLVADDNRTNRNVLAAILEAAGHHVSMAADGDEALLELEKGQTDILLLDVNMPRLSGIDACVMWRQREGGITRLPIIGVTADATSETEAKCVQAGMDLRITKPVDAALLLSTIEKFCDPKPNLQKTQCVVLSPPSNKVVQILRDAPPPIDHVQIEYLQSIGDQAFVNTMIEGFFEDIEQTLEPMRQATKTGNISEFRFCAHAFKSSGNNMGAVPLTRLCAQLEKISEAEFSDRRFDYLSQIELEVSRATQVLKADIYKKAAQIIAING